MSRKDSQMERGKAVSGGESWIGTVFHQNFGQGQIAFEARLLQSRSAFAVELVQIEARQMMAQKVLDLIDWGHAQKVVELVLEARI